MLGNFFFVCFDVIYTKLIIIIMEDDTKEIIIFLFIFVDEVGVTEIKSILRQKSNVRVK